MRPKIYTLYAMLITIPLFINGCAGIMGIRAGVPEPLVVFAEDLRHADGLAYDSAGNLYVACEGLRGFVVRIDPYGNRSVIAKGLPRADGVALDRQDNLYVSIEWPRGAIYKVMPDGKKEIIATGLVNPEGLAFDANDQLYVAEDRKDGQILRVRDGKIETWASGLARPEGIVFGKSGSLYVNETAKHQVTRINSMNEREILVSPGTLRFPDGIARCSHYDGLFITEDIASGRLVHVTYEGVISVIAEGLNRPQGIACDREGNLVVSEQGRGRVLRIMAADLKRIIEPGSRRRSK